MFPSDDGQYLLGEVADTGIGIPKDKLSLIFQPFYQINGTLARQAEGSGLGLSITKTFVELHHGILEIDSQEGVGTTVRFGLPLNPPHETLEDVASGSCQESPTKGAATLVRDY